MEARPEGSCMEELGEIWLPVKGAPSMKPWLLEICWMLDVRLGITILLFEDGYWIEAILTVK